jgi:hypothetical protein
MAESVVQIWKKLTPSQRRALLEEANLAYSGYDDTALIRAGIKKREHAMHPLSSGSELHVLGRKGLLEIGQVIAAPTTTAGLHTPRKITALGRAVAEHGLALLRAPLPASLAVAAISTGHEPETVEGGRAMMQAITPEHLRRAEDVRRLRALSPGDEVEYTNYTGGGSYKGTAIVTWDHGRTVEARTLSGREKLRLERAPDGTLRRFT